MGINWQDIYNNLYPKILKILKKIKQKGMLKRKEILEYECDILTGLKFNEAFIRTPDFHYLFLAQNVTYVIHMNE